MFENLLLTLIIFASLIHRKFEGKCKRERKVEGK